MDILRPGPQAAAKLVPFAAAALLIAAPMTAVAFPSSNPSQAGLDQTGGASAAMPSFRLNPTNRPLRFVVPLSDGDIYLGDVELEIAPDDHLSIAATRLLQILDEHLSAAAAAQLRAAAGSKPMIPAEALEAAQIHPRYDSQKLALVLDVPAAARRTRTMSLLDSGGAARTGLEKPAVLSAYLNLRSTLDYVHRGPQGGLRPPYVLMDSAVRLGGVVAEGEGAADFSRGNGGFQRLGTRLVYDDLKRVMRWTAGDIRPLSRGFQTVPAIGGIQISRLYNVLDPQRNASPRGEQSLLLTQPSTVEMFVNGRSAQRINLGPGSYALRDFPLAQGANDVRLVIEDPAGGRRTVNFSLFSDRSLLDVGLSEFSLTGGFLAEPTRSGLAYRTEAWGAAGFYRRGFTTQLTAGINAQADRKTRQVGAEIVLGTALGLLGLDLAGSDRDDGKPGYAARISFDRLFQSSGFDSQSIRASLERRSAGFRTPGTADFSNLWSLQALVSYSRSFGIDNFISADLRYQRGRFGTSDETGARSTIGLRLSPIFSVVAEAEYGRREGRDRSALRLGLISRFGRNATARAGAESNGRATLSYQDSHGRGTGAWSVSGDIDRSSENASVRFDSRYAANRAELGIAHTATYDSASKRVADQRTSLRIGTAIAFADGAFAIGRPIYDGFAIVTPHPTLGAKRIRIDPSENSALASSGVLGGALANELSAYSERRFVYDVPDAPAGYDLGKGTIEVFPAYRAGYRVMIGSDYWLTAYGRLLDTEGKPVALLAGKATELARPKREPITMFTSRGGAFAIQGLRAGEWIVDMPTTPPARYRLTIRESADGLSRLGDLVPLQNEGAF